MGDIEESLTSKTVRGSFWSLSSNMISRAGALIFTIILARFLLPEGFGIYSLATSIALIFLTFADLGINQTYIRFVSGSINNKKLAKAYFSFIYRIKVYFTLGVTLALGLLSYPLSVYVFHKPELFFPLLLSSLFVLISSFEDFFESSFYITNKVFYMNIKEFVFQVMRISLSLLVFFLLVKTYQVSGVIVAVIISLLVSGLYVYYASRKVLPFLWDRSIKSNKIKINKKEVLSFLYYLSIGSLSGVFFSYIDTVMLGIFLESEFVGFYKAAYTLVFGFVGILTLQPVFLAIFSQSNKESLRNNFNRVLKYFLIILIPVSFGLIVVSDRVISLVYGENYLAGVLLLKLMAFLIIPGTLNNLFLPVLASQNLYSIYAKGVIYSTILNVVLNFVLIKYLLRYSEIWATAGAAIATLISVYLYTMYLMYHLKKGININYDWKAFVIPSFASLAMVLAVGYINPSLPNNLLSFVALVLFGVLIYSALLIMTKWVNLTEVKNILSLIIKKK